MTDEPQSLRAALAKCREAADRFAEDACTQRERADCEMTERIRAEKQRDELRASLARAEAERDALLAARPATVSDECTRCNGVGVLLVGGSARVGCSTCTGTGRAKGGDRG
jgi:DnaJ-class molecular chaperone